MNEKGLGIMNERNVETTEASIMNKIGKVILRL